MRFWKDILFLSSALPSGSWKDTPLDTQQRVFEKCLFENEGVAFLRDHGVSTEDTYATFAKKVPVSSYEKLFPYIERMMQGEENVLVSGRVEKYAKSSGTTNSRSKYIPTTDEYLKGNHLKAGKDIVASYIRAHPDTEIASGGSIGITGSIADVPDTKARAGDISALITEALPWWASKTRPYKKDVALHPSWAHKAEAIAESSKDKDVVSLYGVPTWMQEILETTLSKTGEKSIKDVWPNLEVFFYGGVAFNPYRKQYEALIGGSGIEYRGVYNASEGAIAFEDEPSAHPDELLLCTDHDIFYEFVPFRGGVVFEKETVDLSGVVVGQRYALVLTTTGGLWRYLIGDVIEFTSTVPYRLKIVGRTTQYINAFGEELVADNAVHAIEQASTATGAEVRAFTATASFDAPPAQGTHEWVFEFVTPPTGLDPFRDVLDEALRERNSDYDAKRTGDVILGLPRIHSVPEGTFRRYMEAKGKLGAQNKIPMLSNEGDFVKEILNLAKL